MGAVQTAGRAVPDAVMATIGLRPLSDQEEQDLGEYFKRAQQAGYEVKGKDMIRVRMNIMMRKYSVAELWNNGIGKEIELKYGRRGERLDVKEK